MCKKCLDLILSVLLLALEFCRYSAGEYGPAEYCHRDTFNATCENNEIVVMQTARYGRMSLGKCVKRDLGYLGCAVDVIDLLDSRCSGHTSCTVKIIDDALYQTHPCPDDTTAYLQASYSCIKVAVDEEQQCTSHGSITRTDRVGLLATHITEEYGWGGSACPWVLRVPPGQRINITLFNFARTGGSELLTSDPSVCYELASIREKGHSSKTILTCGTDQRQKNVYISETNEIEIRFVDRLSLRNLGKFLVQHEALGCPKIKVPAGAWLKSDGLTASIHCNQSEQTWYFTCKGNKWEGKFENCSSGSNGGGFLGAGEQFPYPILIVVAIGVALGVFIGGLLLSLAIYFLRRQQAKKEEAFLRAQMADNAQEPKDFVDERSLHWANYAHGPYGPNNPNSDVIPYDPRNPDKDTYAHGRMNPNDYGPRHHIYESPSFT